MLPVKNDRFNILFVGRIEGRKVLISRLRAIAKVKRDDRAVTVVGDGPLKNEVVEYVGKAGLGTQVYFAGRISDKELPAYYRGADIFCSPATHGESFGIVLLEAMASGLPIVAFANTGYTETLKNYPRKDALVKPRDVNALAASIAELVDDKNLCSKLGSFGLLEAKKFAWPKVAQEVEGFYQKVRQAQLLD